MDKVKPPKKTYEYCVVYGCNAKYESIADLKKHQYHNHNIRDISCYDYKRKLSEGS